LLAALDDEGDGGLSDQEISDQIVTLIFAGYETTTNALSWTFYLLAQHPDIAARVQAATWQRLAGRAPMLEDLPHLDDVRMVLEEAMRLYPPAWSFSRRAVADDVVCGYRLPAGATVLLIPYTTHRHPRFWDDPDRFDPDRFAPERAATRPRDAYMPFGACPLDTPLAKGLIFTQRSRGGRLPERR
jgi:cytochrome P450